MKNQCEKYWKKPSCFIEKIMWRYVNLLFFSNGRPNSEKSKFRKSLFFIEKSIQNHARNVDVRAIAKSSKHNAKMESISIKNRWKIHRKIEVGKRMVQNQENRRPEASKRRKTRPLNAQGAILETPTGSARLRPAPPDRKRCFRGSTGRGVKGGGNSEK